MTAYSDLNEKLDKIGIEYESYLQNMGRQLFYTIASIYITSYLAIVSWWLPTPLWVFSSR